MKKTDSPGTTPKKRGGGPKTPEGKARSAMNAARHGLTAETIVLPGEESSSFEELLADYVHLFAPDNRFELDLIHELAATRWRMQRAWCLETTMFGIGIRRSYKSSTAEFGPDIPEVGQSTLAFIQMSSENHELQLINRYEGRLTRRFHQILAEIKSLRNDGLIRNFDPPLAPAPAPSPAGPPSTPVSGNVEPNHSAPPREIGETNSTPPALRPESIPSGGEPRTTANRKVNSNSSPAPRKICETNSPARKPFVMRRIPMPLAPVTGYRRRCIDVPVDPNTRLVPCPRC